MFKSNIFDKLSVNTWARRSRPVLRPQQLRLSTGKEKLIRRLYRVSLVETWGWGELRREEIRPRHPCCLTQKARVVASFAWRTMEAINLGNDDDDNYDDDQTWEQNDIDNDDDDQH